MSEIDAEVLRRLVTGRKNDGRAVYDPQAKAEVVRACMKPGVSVAGMALQCGINANLLRRWISQSMGADRKQSQVDTRPWPGPVRMILCRCDSPYPRRWL